MKICTKCKVEKLLSEFYKNKGYKDGLASSCKACGKEYRQSEIGGGARRKYRQQHVEKTKVYDKEYRQTEEGKEAQRKGRKKYYQTIKGHLRRTFRNMESRCTNPKATSYRYYGARGIEVKFKSLDEFRHYVADKLGYDTFDKIKGLQIDRMNNDGHYEPGNIRFVTCKENSNNRRNSVVG